MRIRGLNEETGEADEDLKNINNDISEFTNGKVSLMEDEDTYRSTYDILSDISDIWDEITDKQQAGLLETLFGKNRANIGAAILDNFDAARESLDKMAESAGSADKEMGIIQESLSYKVNKLKEDITGIWQNLLQRGDLGVLMDGLDNFLSMIDRITEKFGLLGTAAAGFGIFEFVKNFSYLKSQFSLLAQFAAVNGVIPTGIDALKAGFAKLAAAIGVSTTALGAFIAVAAGIAAVVAIYDHFTESFDELKEKANTSISNYETTKSNLENVNEELDKTKARIRELEAHNGNLKPMEEAELTKLKSYNEELERQKEFLENLADIQRDQAARDSAAVLQKDDIKYKTYEQGEETSYYGGKTGKSYDVIKQGTIVDRYKAAKDALDDLKKEELEVQNRLASYTDEEKTTKFFGDTPYEEDVERLKYLQDSISEAEATITEDGTLINKYYQSLLDDVGNFLPGFESIGGEIRDALFSTPEDEAKRIQESFDSIIKSSSGYQKQFNELVSKAKKNRENGGLTADDITEEYQNLLNSLAGEDFTIDDLLVQVNAEAKVLNKGELKSQLEAELQDDMDKIESGEIEFKPDLNIDTGTLEEKKAKIEEVFAQLNSDQQQRFVELMSQGIDWQNWDVGDIPDKIRDLVNAEEEAIDVSSEFTGEMSDLDIVFSDDSEFKATIDGYVESLDTLQAALDKIHSGDFEMSDLITLQQQFAELNNYDMSNIEFGILSVMDDIQGHAADATDSVDEFGNAIDVTSDEAQYGTGIIGAFNKMIEEVGGSSTEAGEALEQMKNNIISMYQEAITAQDILDNFSNYQSNLNDARLAAVSSGGLNSEQIENLRKAYSELPSYDASQLFVNTRQGVSLDMEVLKDYNQQIEQQVLSDLYAKKAELEAQKETGVNTDNIDLEIEKTQQLITQYEGMTSAYSQWLNAQSGSNERDMYESLGKSAYESVEKRIDAGWYDDNMVNAYLDTMLDKSVRTGDALKDFAKLQEEIIVNGQHTGYSMKDFWIYDDEGTLQTDGLLNFLDVVQQIHPELASISEEGGNIVTTFDLTNESINQLAEETGISAELIEGFVHAMAEVDPNIRFNLEADTTEIETAETETESLKSKIEGNPIIQTIKTKIEGAVNTVAEGAKNFFGNLFGQNENVEEKTIKVKQVPDPLELNIKTPEGVSDDGTYTINFQADNDEVSYSIKSPEGVSDGTYKLNIKPDKDEVTFSISPPDGVDAETNTFTVKADVDDGGGLTFTINNPDGVDDTNNYHLGAMIDDDPLTFTIEPPEGVEGNTYTLKAEPADNGIINLTVEGDGIVDGTYQLQTQVDNNGIVTITPEYPNGTDGIDIALNVDTSEIESAISEAQSNLDLNPLKQKVELEYSATEPVVSTSTDPTTLSDSQLKEAFPFLGDISGDPSMVGDITINATVGDVTVGEGVSAEVPATADVENVDSSAVDESPVEVHAQATTVDTEGAVPTAPVKVEAVATTVNLDGATGTSNLNVDNSSAKEAVSSAKQDVSDFNNTTGTAKLDADATGLESKVSQSKSELDSIDAETATPKIDADNSGLIAKVDVSQTKVEGLDAMSAHPVADLVDQASAGITNISNNLSNLDGKTATVTVRNVTINETQNVTTGGSNAYGTLNSRAHGTAYGNGSVSLSKDELALVNELGTESIIRNGHWFIIPGGMHQEQLRKGDIVLSAEQTKSLIKTGAAPGHGRAYAGGTANFGTHSATGGSYGSTTANVSVNSSSSGSSYTPTTSTSSTTKSNSSNKKEETNIEISIVQVGKEDKSWAKSIVKDLTDAIKDDDDKDSDKKNTGSKDNSDSNDSSKSKSDDSNNSDDSSKEVKSIGELVASAIKAVSTDESVIKQADAISQAVEAAITSIAGGADLSEATKALSDIAQNTSSSNTSSDNTSSTTKTKSSKDDTDESDDEPVEKKLKIKVVEKSETEKESEELVDTINDSIMSIGDTEAHPKVDVDDEDLVKKVDNSKAKLDNLGKKATKIKLFVDDSDVKKKAEESNSKLAKIDKKDVEPTIDADDAAMAEKVKQSDEKLSKLNKKSSKSKIDADNTSLLAKANESTVKLNTLNQKKANPLVKANDQASSIIQSITSLLNSVDGKTATTTVRNVTINETKNVTTNESNAYGTLSSHAKGSIGNAYAGGNVALSDDELALVNELGTESIIRNGRWFIIPGGMHQEQLKKGDIILSAEQTRSLIKTGAAPGHGRSYAFGSLGNAYAKNTMNSGKHKPTGGSYSTTVSVSTGGSSKSSSNSNTSKSSSSSSSKSSKKKDNVSISIVQVNDGGSKNNSIVNTFENAVKKGIEYFNNNTTTQTESTSSANANLPYYVTAQRGTGGNYSTIPYFGDTKRLSSNGFGSLKDAEPEVTVTPWDDDKEGTPLDDIIEKYNNTLQSLAHVIEREDNLIERRNAYASDYVTSDNAVSASTSNIASYQKMVADVNKEITERETELVELQSTLDNYVNSGMSKTSKKYYEMESQIIDLENTIDDLYKDVIDYSNSISEEYVNLFETVGNEFENKLSEAQHLVNIYDSALDIAEKQGFLTTSKYYEVLKSVQKNNISELQKEYNQLTQAMTNALRSGEIQLYSQAWYDMMSKINETSEAIQEAKTKVVELENSIQQASWDNFDYLQTRISNLTTESEFLIKLLSNNELTKESGGLSDAGMATAGLHAMNYNVYMSQADDYAKQIIAIQKEIAKNPANTTLIERESELYEAQRKSILSAEQEKEALKDLVEDGIKAETDALDDLIDKYKDSLSSAKDLYSFQKKLKEQTEDIASLQKQLSAYSNDDSEETKATVQKLKVELEKSQESLDSALYDQYVKDQKALLDDFYDEYEEKMNERFDSVNFNIDEIITSINGNSGTIAQTINEATSAVGYTMTDSMQTIWNEQSSAVSNLTNLVNIYSENFNTASSAIHTAINEIKKSVDASVASSQAESQSLLKELQNTKESLTKAYEEAAKAATTNKANTKTTAVKATTTQKPTTTTTRKTFSYSDIEKVATGSPSSVQTYLKGLTVTDRNTFYNKYLDYISAGKYNSISDPYKKYLAEHNLATVEYYLGISSPESRKLKEAISSPYGYYNIDSYMEMMYRRNWGYGGYYGDYYGGYGSRYSSSLYGNSSNAITPEEALAIIARGYASGTKRAGKTGLAWTNENWDTIGGETIVRSSDHAVLQPIGANDRIYNALASSNLWEMANDPAKFISKNIGSTMLSTGQNAKVLSSNVNLENVNFNFPSVKNYEEFVTKMQNDKKFESMIQNMTIGAMMGRNNKNAIVWNR